MRRHAAVGEQAGEERQADHRGERAYKRNWRHHRRRLKDEAREKLAADVMLARERMMMDAQTRMTQPVTEEQ